MNNYVQKHLHIHCCSSCSLLQFKMRDKKDTHTYTHVRKNKLL